MQILNQLETEPIPIAEEEKRHSRRLVIGFLCALLLTGAVFGGYLYLLKRHERQVAAQQALENQKKVTRVEVFVDEATVNGKTTLLAGTIHNISSEPLHNVAVELQLRRRTGGARRSTDAAWWSWQRSMLTARLRMAVARESTPRARRPARSASADRRCGIRRSGGSKPTPCRGCLQSASGRGPAADGPARHQDNYRRPAGATRW